MRSHLRANLWLLLLTLLLCSVLYPALLLGIGQTVFRDQAQGSLLTNAEDKVIGSRLIAQPFTGDEYFQPRPSAASYKADASGGSNYGANNYALRDRVARQLGPIVRYGKGAEKDGKKPGELVGQDIDAWFQGDRYQNEPGIVKQWAALHAGLAEAWIKSTGEALKEQWKGDGPEKEANENFTAQWQEDYPELHATWKASAAYADWKKKNPGLHAPKAADLITPFFESFATAYPGYWPYLDEVKTSDKLKRKKLTRVKEAGDNQTEIRSVFFDMWRNDHPGVPLEEVPADMVTTSGSGLDPDITLANAQYQLKYRVAAAQAQKLVKERVEEQLKARPPGLAPVSGPEREQLEKQANKELQERMGKPVEDRVREVIESVLQERKQAPLGGLVGVEMVNVLELNLAVTERLAKLVKASP